MNCQHENFNAFCEVGRVSKDEGGPVVVYSLDVRIECRECGQQLEFVGVPNGMSFYRPTVSIDCGTLHAPMVIPGEQVPEGMAGFSVTHTVFDQKEATKQ